MTTRGPERRRSWWSDQIYQTREKDRRLADRQRTEDRRQRLAAWMEVKES